MVQRPRIGMRERRTVSAKCRRRNHIDTAAFVKYGNRIRNEGGKINIMRDQQYTFARIREFPQNLQCLGGAPGIHPGRRLIGNNKRGVRNHSGRKEHTPRHPARKLKRIQRGDMLLQMQAAQCRLHILLRPMQPANLCADAHERVEIGYGLRNQRDLLPAQYLLTRGIKRCAAAAHLAAHHGIVGQNPEHGVREQTFA